jgi:hypothetical protein
VDAFSHTERLAKLITLKHDVLTQLHRLAQRQLEVIAADEMDRLMSLLAEKQKLLTQMQRVEQALEPYRQEDANARQWRSAEHRRSCQVTADRANLLLSELLTFEKQAEGGLLQSRDATARELQEASGAYAARQAYVSSPGSAAGGFDLVSES